jgi:hypothetical protein
VIMKTMARDAARPPTRAAETSGCITPYRVTAAHVIQVVEVSAAGVVALPALHSLQSAGVTTM